MGLLDDYQIDTDEVPDAPSFDVDDDIYPFIIGNAFIQEGNSKDEDQVSLVIEYNLGDTGKRKSEWFNYPKDIQNPTDKELTKLSFLKRRLHDLLPDWTNEQLNAVDENDLIGLEGTLVVFSKKVGENTYQNIKNVRLAESDEESAGEGPGNKASTFVGEEEEAEEAPAKPAVTKPARKPTAAKAAPAVKTAAKATTAVKNPFAPK